MPKMENYTQSQKNVKKRINPNQDRNLYHLPRDEEAAELQTTLPLSHLTDIALDSRSLSTLIVDNIHGR